MKSYIYFVLLALITTFSAFGQTTGLPAPSVASGGAVAQSCVGNPGNTIGKYQSQCQASTGAVYACNNSAGCSVAADWAGSGTITGVTAGSGLSGGGTSGAVTITYAGGCASNPCPVNGGGTGAATAAAALANLNGVSTVLGTSQSVPILTAGNLGGYIYVDGTTNTSFTAAFAAAKNGSNNTIVLGSGNYNVTAQQVFPDDGTCVNIFGAGENNTTITLTTSLAAGVGMVYKANALPSSGCTYKDFTLNVNKNADYGMDLEGFKLTAITNVGIEDARVEPWHLGGYVGWNSSTVNLATISRSSNTVLFTTTVADTDTAAGNYVVFSGVTGDTTLNGPCSGLVITNSTTFSCTQTGSNSTGSGGSVNTSATSTGFSDMIMSGDDASYCYQGSCAWTPGTQGNYGFHFYPSATDSKALVGLNASGALVSNFENQGSNLHFVTGSAHNGTPVTGLAANYTFEDAGGANSVELMESDEPLLSPIHLLATSSLLTVTGLIDQRSSTNNDIPLAVIENGAHSYVIQDQRCIGAGTITTIWQFNGAVPDSASRLGPTNNCYATANATTSYSGVGSSILVDTTSSRIFENLADSTYNVALNAGLTAVQLTQLDFKSLGTLYWRMQGSSTTFTMDDATNNRIFLQMNTNGNLYLNAESTGHSVDVNMEANSGTSVIFGANGTAVAKQFPSGMYGSGYSTNTDVSGELAFAGVTTASYTFAGTYVSHPVCNSSPEATTATSGQPWITYTSTTSFTINFAVAFTGNVGYTCLGRN